VQSLAHPGANTSGISILATELDGKRLEMLLDAVPLARRVAILADPAVSKPSQLERLSAAAAARGISASTQLAASAERIIPAVDAALSDGAEALAVLASSLLNRYRAQIMATATRLPAIYQWPETAEEGGLIAYGPRFVTIYRQHALQAVKVLNGTKPMDIPVEQPTTFELVINLKTARRLDLAIPPALLARADVVIE
jgi:putative ABC transport system substrate-binding protein